MARRRILSVGALALSALALALFAAGCGGSSSAATPPAGTTTTTTAGGGPSSATFQKFTDCLTSHGVTLPQRPAGGGGGGGGGTPPAGGAPGGGGGGFLGQLTAKQRAAFTACQSLRPAGGRGLGGRGGNGPANSALTKYTACLKSHGVAFGTSSASGTTFAKAAAACKSLLPKTAAGTVNNGTSTTG